MLITRIGDVLFSMSRWKFLTLILGLMLIKTGVWVIPNFNLTYAIAQNPFQNILYPEVHYVFWSWLSPFLAWILHARGVVALFLLHLSFSIAFTALFLRLVFSIYPEKIARTAVLLFAFLPVSTTAYFWVSGDSLTLLLMVLALTFSSYSWVVFLFGVLLGLQHFEQGFFAACGLCAALYFKHQSVERYSFKFCLSWLIGVVIGKVLLCLIFKSFGIVVNSGRWYWVKSHYLGFAETFMYRFQYEFWGALGLGWIIALKFLEVFKRQALPFCVILISLCCLLLPISGDQTRVLGIVTFPLLTVFWFTNESFLKQLSIREIALLFCVWVFLPYVWLWEATPKYSIFVYDIIYLLHHLFGWFVVPAGPLWPF